MIVKTIAFVEINWENIPFASVDTGKKDWEPVICIVNQPVIKIGSQWSVKKKPFELWMFFLLPFVKVIPLNIIDCVAL